MDNTQHYGKHFVAVIGGSVAGSEAAWVLANNGFRVVVFEQKALPYGKIEDGLPKWHIKLRDKEEANIDKKMSHENIRYVPNVRLGEDIMLDDLIKEWGFSAVILAIGAWRDRPIPIKGIGKYTNRGVIYQNDLIFWFNHNHEPGFRGPSYEIVDGTGVVGGGLASLDVMKIVMMELVGKALKEKKGIDTNMFELEKKGIAKKLDELNTSFDELGIKGATLFYRRNAEDMPLKAVPNDLPETRERARKVSKKLLETYRDKFLFKFEPRSIPVGLIEENGKFGGLRFQRVEIKDGKLIPIEGEEYDFKTNLIISSIGSLPEKIPGLPYDGDYIKTEGANARVVGYNNVFAIGNAVTGRGNILESKKHGREITEKIIDEHLDPMAEKFANWFSAVNRDVDEDLVHIIAILKNEETKPDYMIEHILERTKKMQQRVGFDGNYLAWVEKHKPIRLENLI